MSEKLNRENRDFSKYDAMETEELEEILRLDAEAPEGAESDTELLLYVMEVLAERRKKANSTGNTAQNAWKSFEQNYMPENAIDAFSQKGRKLVCPCYVRRIIAAAAVLVLLIMLPVSAKALKLDELWDVVAKWAKETFSFVSGGDTDIEEPSSDRKDEIAALREILENSNHDASIIPTWIPDGFALEKVETDITPAQEVYRARYLNGDKKIRIRVHTYLSSDIQNTEIEDDYVEVYTVSGVDYYIFENVDQVQVIWLNDIYECIISGDLSIDEAKLMIDSIGKG